MCEYIQNRTKELISSRMGSYRNEKGGDFLGERWTSVFLTDSQLLASLFFNYLDEIYKENRLTRQFIVNYPNEPSIDRLNI
jgi:hypothetical protein